MQQGHCGGGGGHGGEHADVADTPQQARTPKATQRKPEEVSAAHQADGQRRETFEIGAHRQQRALQPLAGQQNGHSEQQRRHG